MLGSGTHLLAGRCVALKNRNLKEEKTLIRFGKPRHIPSSLDGIEIYFPYEIVLTLKEGYKLPKEEVNKKGIKVSISGSLAITWGFQIWQPSENYSDLIKLLFPYALEEIEKKMEEGTLNDFEEMILLTTTHPQEREYDINELPEVEGFEKEILPADEKTETISERISSNQIAGDIIQYRDLINAIVYSKYQDKLLELDQERNLLEFFKSVKTTEEFSHGIASLGALIGKMNKKLLVKLSETTDKSLGTLALLEEYVNKLGGDKLKISDPLRQMNRLRQAYPIHTDKAGGVIEAHTYFGLSYPINDFTKAWNILLSNYLNCLKQLFELVKNEMMKK